MNRIFTDKSHVFVVVFLLLTAGCAPQEQPHVTPAVAEAGTISSGFGERVGTVDFQVSCTSEAQRHLQQGLALLHHMTYVGALEAFEHGLEADPACAMAYWGQAMTLIHPLWPDQPTDESLTRGASLLEKAASGRLSDWESAFVAATSAYFEEGASKTEAERLIAFSNGWKKAHEAHPGNPEAMAFYALAYMAAAPKGDLTFRVQIEAGQIAEKVLALNPDHPGAHHYIIHAYDYPELAERARKVSDTYGNVAPDVPHALHMPTHIYTRIGLWEESIDWNIRSARAALKNPVNGAVSMHYLHALDYLAYAYLQRGEDRKANSVLDSLNALEGPIQAHAASAYTAAAVPARIALERKDWPRAASLSPEMPATLPWDRFPQYEAITRFARALGAAHTDQTDLAAAETARLADLKAKLDDRGDAYWSKQVEIQWMAASAWQTYAQGDAQKGLMLMRDAAALEATTQKNPITPGEVLPAQELLGDMLLSEGLVHDALTAYQAALERSPNRYNSLSGAAQAARQAGKLEAASRYDAQFDQLTAFDDGSRQAASE